MTARLVGAILALLLLTTLSSQGAAALTVSSWGFTPGSGGSGTVVNLGATELYNDGPIPIWLGVALEKIPGPGGMITKIQPIMQLGVTQPDPSGGHPTATFVIPSHYPDGTLINESNLAITLTDMNNQPLDGLQIKPFTFIQAVLPATGEQTGSIWLLMFCAWVFLASGLLVRNLESKQWVRL